MLKILLQKFERIYFLKNTSSILSPFNCIEQTFLALKLLYLWATL